MLTAFAELSLFEPFRSPIAWRIMLIGGLTNVACALVGSYLVLRRMSLMGDALAHAVLPGLVLAFVFSGSMNIVPLFIGAAAVGLLTTFLTQTLHQFGRVPTDASMGVVFTSLFALGVVLLKRYITGVHFDVACVYEGSLLQVALDTVDIAGWQVPRGLVTAVPVLAINLLVMALLWKELKLSSFDPALATAMGISATAMHYLLMMLVAVTTVASFEAVGSILVVAMLIVPPATAHLLCDRLSRMVAVACVVAVATAVFGYWFAHVWDVAPAGAMAVVAGLLYGLAVLFSPQYGLLSALVHNLQTSLRILREDLLSMLYRVEEMGSSTRLGSGDALAAVGGGWLARWALWMLRHRGRLTVADGALVLTEDGRTRARKLVRTHRLWETYLVKQLGLPLDHVHEPAHRVEHFTGPEIREQLTKAVEDATQDPHGRDIPG